MPSVYSNPGSRNNGVDQKELFLTIVTGEVLTAFNNATKFKGCNYTRTIEHGKAARFDAVGGAQAKYMNKGDDLLDMGNQFAHDEFVITIDGLLTSSVLIWDLDEAMNHYDVRGRYSQAMGESMAQRYDCNIAQTGIQAARMMTPRVPGGNPGTVISNATFATSVDDFVDGISQAAQRLDEKNVSESGRKLFVRPAEYYRLIKHDKTIHSDFDGDGSISKGVIHELYGFEIVKTNNLPGASVTTDLAKYNGDYSGTLALAMTDEAVGTVKLMDLSTEMERQVSKQADLLVAKYALGHGVLRPECAVEITSK